MKFSNENFYSDGYYKRVLKALYTQSFFQDINYLPLFQIGVWVVERADMVLKNELDHDGALSEVSKLALEAVRAACLRDPDFVSTHLQCTIGAFTYDGLLNTKCAEVKHLWDRVRASCDPNTWLGVFAHYVSVDPDFGQKVREYVELNRDGRSDMICYAEITKTSIQKNRPIPTAEPLVHLGIIDIPMVCPEDSHKYKYHFDDLQY
ncbi:MULTISPECIES: hypothetical protein [Vibrio]|uniref:hypothetical protein n=1 Tax=Vibrio TaxID=662 RepID=UPI00078D625B|nr:MULTISPECIES: hypothetical protein [Vibrio]BAU71061.1 hypothetical protein [Vibrio sp. 04Ya108]BBM67679.1 hypothetical protein VA249_43250 [Vibrio alfacsensis]BCN27176.1 hypothetical protein VYA_43680 [Vibrio alfacsensis]